MPRWARTGAWCHRARAAACAAAILGLCLAHASTAHAGPWTPAQGHGYGKVWLKWLPGFDYHDGAGRTWGYGSYHEIFLAVYAEVGILDTEHIGLAGIVHSDLVRVFVLEDPSVGEATAHVAPGDPALGLRLRFLHVDRFVMAFETLVRAPLANGEPVQDVVSTEPGYPVVGQLRLGSGTWDFTEVLSLGYGFDRIYIAASGGYAFRIEGYDDAVTFTAEGGARTESGFGIRGRVTGYLSIANGTAERAESPSGQGNGTSYIGFALEADWRVAPRWYIGCALEGGLFYLRRQTAGPVVSVYGALEF